MAVIYGLFDPRKPIELENCRYIGQTEQLLKDRLNGHLSDARKETNRYVCNWIRSLFRDGVRPIILELETVVVLNNNYEALDAAECRWITKGRLDGWRLTNDADGGHGSRGHRHSEETRTQMSASAKGKPKSLEHRANLSEALTGKPPTDAQMEAAAKRRGIPLSEETRQKQSEGIKNSDVMQAYWATLIGQPLSESHRKAISDAHTGNPKIIEAAHLGGQTFKEKFESDSEFAAAWFEANQVACNEAKQRMLKRRMRCDECGMISNPQGIGHHQTTFGHTGKTEIDPVED